MRERVRCSSIFVDMRWVPTTYDPSIENLQSSPADRRADQEAQCTVHTAIARWPNDCSCDTQRDQQDHVEQPDTPGRTLCTPQRNERSELLEALLHRVGGWQSNRRPFQ